MTFGKCTNLRNMHDNIAETLCVCVLTCVSERHLQSLISLLLLMVILYFKFENE